MLFFFQEIYVYRYIYLHAITVKKLKAMNLKESEMHIWEDLEEGKGISNFFKRGKRYVWACFCKQNITLKRVGGDRPKRRVHRDE